MESVLAKRVSRISFLLFAIAAICGCKQASEGDVSSPRYMYVASGACYGGGVTALTGSATIVAFDLSTGEEVSMIADYNGFSMGDSPVGIGTYDTSHVLVAVENTGGRRIDKVALTGFNDVATYLTNALGLNGVLRGLFMLGDGGFLVSKTTAIEKFSSGKSRILQGAAPYVSNPAGSCSTSTTLISSVKAFSTGNILYTHAAATPNNRFGVITAAGYAAAPDCLSAQAAPTTTAMPTHGLIHSSGKVLISYGSTTAASNSIYSYDVDATTGAITNPVAAFTDFSIVNGPSVMVEDPSTGAVYVANATNSFSNIEKFTLSAGGVLTRVGTSPFIKPSVYTRCVSAMYIPY